MYTVLYRKSSLFRCSLSCFWSAPSLLHLSLCLAFHLWEVLHSFFATLQGCLMSPERQWLNSTALNARMFTLPSHRDTTTQTALTSAPGSPTCSSWCIQSTDRNDHQISLYQGEYVWCSPCFGQFVMKCCDDGLMVEKLQEAVVLVVCRWSLTSAWC